MNVECSQPPQETEKSGKVTQGIMYLKLKVLDLM
jgi:hypothetical protein